MSFCPKCGTEMPEEGGACPSCGFEPEPPVETPSAPDPNYKFCQYCGAKVLKQAVVCPKCGCDIDESRNAFVRAKKARSQYSSSAPGFGFGIASIVCSFVCIFIFGWLGFVGFALGVPGIIVSAVKKTSSRGLKIAGLILSIIGTSMGLIFGVVWAAALSLY